ncbi:MULTISPECIES: hypothetical protein [Streptosporangium]|uniref:Lipoprotein n=1 Tax=Streptosporangium brasiliense TaxID=47480 RepID=A0ABT9RCB3_9ACTN|nr:hypothetical protein [Streptosporangium brasiliense]MDP9866894.1 hypothetical protein [Streptosporangium brasiliense]
MRVVRLLAIGSALMMAASGCTSEPSLKEVAAQLQKDTQRLEADDVFKNPLKKLRILQRPDKDIPCAKDGFRRVLRATADYQRSKEEVLDSHLDGAQRLMENTLSQTLGYRMEYDISQADAPEGRFIHGSKEIGIIVNVYVAPEAPTWRLHAQTACLRR